MLIQADAQFFNITEQNDVNHSIMIGNKNTDNKESRLRENDVNMLNEYDVSVTAKDRICGWLGLLRSTFRHRRLFSAYFANVERAFGHGTAEVADLFIPLVPAEVLQSKYK